MIFCPIVTCFIRGIFFALTLIPLALNAEFFSFEILGEVFPMAMNNHGQIVGITSKGEAFLWESSRGIQIVGPNDQRPSTTYDINDLADMLGRATMPWVVLNSQLAFTSKLVWRLDEQSNFLFERAPASGASYGRNSLGDQVGSIYSNRYNKNYATLNNNVIMTAYSEANAVNNLKQVVGWAENPLKLNQFVSVDIERYRNIPSGRIIFNCGKNLWHNENYYGSLKNSEGFHNAVHKMAFVWKKDTYILLDGFGGPVSEACDVNDNGDIVGLSTINSQRLVNHNPQVLAYVTKAILWKAGRPIDLMALIPDLPKDISLRVALFINDSGQILCSGLRNNKQCALLLTPNTEL